MDDEDLANVLRSTANVGLPGFYSNNDPTPQPAIDDPFANPFANPFASDSPTFPQGSSGFAGPSEAVQDDNSPYVTKLRDDGVVADTPGFGYSQGHDGDYIPAASTSGFREAPYSGGFETQQMAADPAQTPFEVPAFPTTPFGTTSPSRAGGFNSSQGGAYTSPGRPFDDPYGMPRSPLASAPAATGTTSPARIRPSSDILGLLSEEDPSISSLKKAFKASDGKQNSSEVKSVPPAAPHVFKPGGNASRKKVGISFDSVQREREKKEREERARIDAETKRKQEQEKADKEKADKEKADKEKADKEKVEQAKSDIAGDAEKQSEGDQGRLEQASTDSVREPNTAAAKTVETEKTKPGQEGESAPTAPNTVSGESILEQAARDAASPTPPGPHVSTIVAAQILESGHPNQASQEVAEGLAHHQDGQFIDGEVRPEQVALPPSGITSPVVASRRSTPSPELELSSRTDHAETQSVLPTPLDANAGIETHFQALALGDSSRSEIETPEATSAITESSLPRNARWGRAFDDTESATPASRMDSPSEPLGWTTEVTLPQPTMPTSSYGSQSPPNWQFGTSADVQGEPSGAYMHPPNETYDDHQALPAETSNATESVRSPTRNRLLTQPVFTISISDPTKVGDPVRGYIVYTVTTRTTSPHYKRGEFSVLRRFSDFLWLVEAVSHNNPGVVVPPMPDKHAFGRFEEQFVETRRSALERALGKMANHPVLSLDPDLKLFLSSDAFTIDVKHRRQEMTQEKQSVLASIGGTIGGPRFVEQDEWFIKQKQFLDSLESQIKSLVKALETSSKQRLDLVNGFAVLSEALQALAESDLSLALSQVLHRFSQLSEEERSLHENQAKMDVVRLLNVADEQLRLIGSVRAAFSSRIRSYFAWQNAQSEARRTRVQSERDRAKKGGKYAPHDHNVADAPDIAQAERRALDAQSDFDAVSRLVKLEFSRFEQERIEDLKSTMEKYIDEAVEAQQKLVQDWEAFHKELSGILAQHQRTSS